MKEEDNFTPLEYLEMVKNQIEADNSPGKARSIAWAKDLKAQLDKLLCDLERDIDK